MIIKKNVLLTGMTGGLGAQFLKIILSYKRNKDLNFFLLVRAHNKYDAENRVNELLKKIGKKESNQYQNLTILVGDVQNKNLGLSKKEFTLVSQKIDVIFHFAALTRFHDPLNKLRAVNVNGTKRILNLLHNSAKAIELHYISTAFIAGNFNGIFKEENFSEGQAFNNPYEQSKFEAEKEVRKFFDKKHTICIYRPGIVVGEYKSGYISDFQMFYKPLYLLSKEVFKEIPINKKTRLNLIPVDIAAKMIFCLAMSPKVWRNNVYHIVSPKDFHILKVIDQAARYFKFKKPCFYKRIIFKDSRFTRLYENPIKPFMRYFTFRAKFGCDQTLKELKDLNFYLPNLDKEFLRRIFSYAVKARYIEINKRLSSR